MSDDNKRSFDMEEQLKSFSDGDRFDVGWDSKRSTDNKNRYWLDHFDEELRLFMGNPFGHYEEKNMFEAMEINKVWKGSGIAPAMVGVLAQMEECAETVKYLAENLTDEEKKGLEGLVQVPGLTEYLHNYESAEKTAENIKEMNALDPEDLVIVGIYLGHEDDIVEKVKGLSDEQKSALRDMDQDLAQSIVSKRLSKRFYPVVREIEIEAFGYGAEIPDDLLTPAILEGHQKLSDDEKENLWTDFPEDAGFVIKYYGGPVGADDYKYFRDRFSQSGQVFARNEDVVILSKAVSEADDTERIVTDIISCIHHVNSPSMAAFFINFFAESIPDNPNYAKNMKYLMETYGDYSLAIRCASYDGAKDMLEHVEARHRDDFGEMVEYMERPELVPLEQVPRAVEGLCFAKKLTKGKEFVEGYEGALKEGYGEQYLDYILGRIRSQTIGGGNYRTVFSREAV